MFKEKKKKEKLPKMDDVTLAIPNLTVIDRLSKEIRSSHLTQRSARHLVDMYYQIQDFRIQAEAQARAATDSEEPNAVSVWLFRQMEALENQIKNVLDDYSNEQPLGRWARSIYGIGPVLGAGLLANIDISRATYATGVWRHAGLDPSLEWLGRAKSAELVNRVMGKSHTVNEEHLMRIGVEIHRRWTTIKQLATIKKKSIKVDPEEDEDDEDVEEEQIGKITKLSLIKALSRKPYNGNLKTLCFKIGESFVHCGDSDKNFYGRLYRERKVLYQYNNEQGQFTQAAAEKLDKYKIGKGTDAYKSYISGKLPPAHIHARARRFAVKIFLAHYFEVGFALHHKRLAPRPYIQDQGGHEDIIPAPNFDFSQIA